MTSDTCTRDGCQVAQTGKCLEAFEPLSECPYLKNEKADENTAQDKGVFVALPSGEALTEATASEVTREGPTKVIVIAGPHDSGKTTILVSLYDAFLEAPMANYLFAGSRTLIGFERRCHDSREESGRKQPLTKRTPVTEQTEFLHLKLTPAANITKRQNVLLSDISGERFRALRDSADAVRGMRLLSRADYITIVIDGKKLVSLTDRQSASTDARMLLRSILDAKVISSDCRIQVVFSKWDVVASALNDEVVTNFIEEVKTSLKRAAQDVGIEFFQIAARPESTKLPFAFGLPTLLKRWMEDSSEVRPHLYLPKTDDGTREFTRFSKSVATAQKFESVYDIRWI